MLLRLVLTAALVLVSCSTEGQSDAGSGGGAAAGGGGVGAGGGTGGAGCQPGTATLSGTLAFPVAQALFCPHDIGDGGYDLVEAGVALFERAHLGTCRSSLRDNAVLLGVAFRDGGVVVAQRAYPIGGVPFSSIGGAAVYLATGDGAVGGTVYNAISQSGTITFTQLDLNHAAGSFAVTMLARDGGMSSLSANFDAPTCSP